jgi:hypothetical protein
VAQCQGTTRKGERCKRDAKEGSRYCSIHFEQDTSDHRTDEPVTWDRDTILKTALGVAVVGAVLFLRIRR